ncbi:hypothetical protein [Flavitalea sp.]|nr:hypothetical protein [Flavitalea sp.]
MDRFFLIIEVLGYLFAIYLFSKKKELAIIYLPVIIFSNNIIEPVFSASIYYGTISFLILYGILRNGTFFKNNIYALVLFCYFFLLLTRSGDLVAIRSNAFSVFWLFVSIPLIAAIYKKYSADAIFRELSNSAFLILLLFVANVLMSTINHYSPAHMYGIAGGILYGNIYAAGFNILSIAVFIMALQMIMTRKLTYILLVILAYSFIMLSLRRTVMLVSSIGILVPMITLLFKKEAKQFILLGSFIVFAGFFIYSGTGFGNELKERYELRQLNERELENEPRIAEYELIYKDMFVYNAYSPLIGFGLFNSSGHYGKGVFELRTLHGDLPSIAHSSGILGVILYCLMIITVFKMSLGAASLIIDKSIVFFAAVAFLVFAGTGRFTESGSMLLIFLLLMLPLARSNMETQSAISTDNNAINVLHKSPFYKDI